MSELVVRDDRELRRIEAAIAALRRDRPSFQTRHQCLLAALEAERDELLKLNGRRRRIGRIAA